MAPERTPIFSCRDLQVFVGNKKIVKGVDLDIYAGEKHALMGPNGSGKSTMASALMGHPDFRVEGEIFLDGKSLKDLTVDERAKAGLFLGFQYPVAVPGVTVENFLRAALNAKRGEEVRIREFREVLSAAFKVLDIPKAFALRYLNDGFSGGEKKRLEILQLMMLKPSVAILDETDSGLDIDALKLVSEGINRATGDKTGVLLITHYQRMLNYIKPDKVHVFKDGKIIRSGGPELALELEDRGYDWLNGDQAAL